MTKAQNAARPQSQFLREDRKAVHCFIHTPLSYLCLREFLAREGHSRRYLGVIARASAAASQIGELAERDEWDLIRYLLAGYGRGFRGKALIAPLIFGARLGLGRMLARIGPQDVVVVSHLGNPFTRLIIERCRAAGIRVVTIDDGTNTLIEYSALTRDGALTVENSPARARTVTARLEETFFSSAPVAAADVAYFSFWSLVENGPKLLGRNRFDLLRSGLANLGGEDTVFFLGQPFVRRGLLAPEAYAAILEQIVGHFARQGLRFVYFPHRGEAAHEFSPSCEVSRPELPFELHVVQGRTLPRVIAGFYSTGLVTTKFILGERVRHEVFWGFDALAPSVGHFPLITGAFRDEAERSATFLINTELGSVPS